MRFYEVQDGRITIDGVDIMDMKRGDLRALFGMVLQDTWLFNRTIRDNIAYGRKGRPGKSSTRPGRPTPTTSSRHCRTAMTLF